MWGTWLVLHRLASSPKDDHAPVLGYFRVGGDASATLEFIRADLSEAIAKIQIAI